MPHDKSASNNETSVFDSVFDSAMMWIKHHSIDRPRVKENSENTTDIRELGQYQPLLLARAGRLTQDLPPRISVEDLVQETLLEAHKSLNNFNGQTEAEMIMWLSRILSNNIADTFRSLRRKKRDISRERPIADQSNATCRTHEEQLVSPIESPSYFARSAEEEAELVAAIQQLPPAQQDAVVMHHLQEQPLSKVAEALGRSRSAVAGLVFRGLKTLRAKFDVELRTMEKQSN